MSVIAVEKKLRSIIFAFDSQFTMGERVLELHEEKVITYKNLTFGVTGDNMFRDYMLMFLQEEVSEDTYFDTLADLYKFIDKFNLKYKDNKQLELKDGNTATLLISDSRKVYRFNLHDHGAYEVIDFEVIGSGAEICRGAYKAYREASMHTSAIGDPLRRAIVLTCAQNIYCHEPVNIIEIPRNRKKTVN